MISRLALLCALAATNCYSQAPIPSIPRLLPPLGAEIPATESTALQDEVQALRKECAALAANPLLPDAEIYVESVALALDNQEWDKSQDTALAKAQLGTARQRLADLRAGHHPWTTQAGLVVRGFRSAIDGSVQPFGVESPAGYDFKGRPGPMYVWLHGRGDKETNLYFIRNRESKKGQFLPPPGTLQIHPFGRHCLGYKSTAEIDVLEAVAAAQKMYPIDANKVALMGFSMGGAGAWHLGAHYADLWAVVHPGAGFVDVRRYTNADPANVPPWESTLWGLYDVPDYARNFLNRPLVAYSGEVDKQKAAADIMEATLKAEGLEMKHFIGPKMPHKYDPAVLKKLQTEIDSALASGRNTRPEEIHFQTKTLRYHKFAWVDLTGLDEHWKDSRIDAKLDGGVLKIATKNLTGFNITPGIPFKSLEIDGRPVSESIRRYVKLAGQWQGMPPDWGRRAVGVPPDKSPGLQGPMDDILLTPFLVVLPSRACAHPAVDRWAQFEIARFAKQWRELFRGRLRVKKDAEVTAEDIKNYSLVLWGDPSANSLLAKLNGQLPVKWSREAVTLAGKNYPAASHIPALIYPNPLNPARYVALNNGCSFREGHCKTNALQNPKLPDWAVFDLSQDPNGISAGKVAAAGFFNEQWQVK